MKGQFRVLPPTLEVPMLEVTQPLTFCRHFPFCYLRTEVCEEKEPILNGDRNMVEFGTFVNSVLFSIKYLFQGGKNEHVRKVLR